MKRVKKSGRAETSKRWHYPLPIGASRQSCVGLPTKCIVQLHFPTQYGCTEAFPSKKYQCYSNFLKTYLVVLVKHCMVQSHIVSRRQVTRWDLEKGNPLFPVTIQNLPETSENPVRCRRKRIHFASDNLENLGRNLSHVTKGSVLIGEFFPRAPRDRSRPFRNFPGCRIHEPVGKVDP